MTKTTVMTKTPLILKAASTLGRHLRGTVQHRPGATLGHMGTIKIVLVGALAPPSGSSMASGGSIIEAVAAQPIALLVEAAVVPATARRRRLRPHLSCSRLLPRAM